MNFVSVGIVITCDSIVKDNNFVEDHIVFHVYLLFTQNKINYSSNKL